MTAPELAAAVPALLRGTILPFTDGRVLITAAESSPASDGSALVAVTFVVDQGEVGHFEFLVDDSWGFGSTQDVIDQLRVDLVEQLDTDGTLLRA